VNSVDCYSAQGLGDLAQIAAESGPSRPVRLTCCGCALARSSRTNHARLSVAHRWPTHDGVFALTTGVLRGGGRASSNEVRLTGWRCQAVGWQKSGGLTTFIDGGGTWWSVVTPLHTYTIGRRRRV
jgi:hypothetical protein